MRCTSIPGLGIICGPRAPRRRCSVAGCCEWMAKLCDHPKGRKTCDARLCARHATPAGPDRDLCPDHAKQLEIAPLR